MYPYTLAPKPLSPITFYILLALSRQELHAYALKGAISNDSLGSIQAKPGVLYPLLTKLFEEGLIEQTGLKPAGKSGQERTHYGITHEGLLQLKDELKRLQHAVKIGEAAGLMADETPTDIQRLLAQLHEGDEP